MAGTDRRWRPPRRDDDRAWALIEAGQWLTEPVRSTRIRWRRTAPAVPYRYAGHRPVPAAPRSAISSQQQVEAILADELPGADERAAALAPFVQDPSAAVRLLIAEHDRTPAAVLKPLLTDADPRVRAAALVHPSAPLTPKLLRRAAAAPEEEVRRAAATRPETPAPSLGTLLADRAPSVATAAAANLSTRQTDLISTPLRLVPPERLPSLLETFAGRPLAGAQRAAALRMLESLRTPGDLPTSAALATAAAVLT
jgi:hypothetical protein